MLINTIILLLRDALPVFWMLSLLLAQGNSQALSRRWLWGGVSLGLMLAIILMVNVGWVSEQFQGAGLEWLTFAAHALIYALVAELVLRSHLGRYRYWQLSAALLCVLTIAINGNYFLIYLDTYWRNAEHMLSLISGTLLGLGVCISAGILNYLFNYALLQRGKRLLWAGLLLCWSAGQWVYTFNLMAQVNLMSSAAPIWNTSNWVADGSEWGLVLNTLVGYEATPTGLQILVYVLCTVLPLAFLVRIPAGQLCNEVSE
ncbi:hypothetical protein [Lacimicrobium sp. SS2-24]|uniref:hypothetical protein n=1 Tax=Lacimicrobium sp. SS2-24 TaxID=2005569 RepID=UPI000B4B03EA|nr:hypothetical protein [Lacimicrobium sp. SS2-24]